MLWRRREMSRVTAEAAREMRQKSLGAPPPPPLEPELLVVPLEEELLELDELELLEELEDEDELDELLLDDEDELEDEPLS